MIISDTHRLAFVHIPKCAGSTVRQALECFDERYKTFAAGSERYQNSQFVFRPEGAEGHIDLPHLTLAQLEQHFPDDFARIANYRSFAILRDPYERLMSSVSQRLRQYENVLVQDLTASAARKHLERILEQVDSLFDQSSQLPFDYIHFQPQSSYVEHSGKRLIEHPIAISRLDLLHDLISEQLSGVGGTLPPFHHQRRNPTKAYRSRALQTLALRNDALLNKLRRKLPEWVKSATRPILYSSGGNALSELADSDEARSFVKRHYARDLELWAEVNATGLNIK